MTNDTQKNTFAEMNHLFGPPPITPEKNAKTYKKFVVSAIECFMARDFMEKRLIRQLADVEWEITHCSRRKVLAAHRNWRLLVQGQAIGICDSDQDTRDAEALKSTIEIEAFLDQLLNAAIARREVGLDHFGRYRVGLGKRELKAPEIVAEVPRVHQRLPFDPPVSPLKPANPRSPGSSGGGR